ncbi:hypothetical protein H0H92_010168 [Tricholoma furcatifolium]|nr:hypothetical protein H0H92_010168 [Tricholoma furcatifolium]
MTDLTVLISPVPLYPAMKPGFTFGRRNPQPHTRPIMVTLETEREPDNDGYASDDGNKASSPPRKSRSPRRFDSTLLSPPPNTWKSRPRHRPTRSQSAPPERKIRKESLDMEELVEKEKIELAPLDFMRPTTRRSLTAFPLDPTTRGGELIRPPPPLLRPTTFWRKTRKSGVSGPSYSPASHLIRRSTFIAAGLSFDSPVHDLSALCERRMVERRLLAVISLFFGGGAILATPSASRESNKVWDVKYERQIQISQPTTSITPLPHPVVVAHTTATPIIPSSSAPVPASVTSSSPVVLLSAVAPSSFSPSSTSLASSTTQSKASSSEISSSLTSSISTVPSQIAYSDKYPVHNHSFKLLYLVPVLVFLGVLWGCLAAWLVYGCLTRRPKYQEEELISGPRYVPTPRDVEDGRPPPPKNDEMEEVTFSWSHLRQQGPKKFERIPDDEDDPFLLPSSPTKIKSARTKSSRSTTTEYSDSAYLLEHDSEMRKDDTPWESLRHKSIKRGILAEVRKEGNRIDSLRPATSVRNTGTGFRKPVERKVSKHARTESDSLILSIDRMIANADPRASTGRPSTHRTDSEITTVSLVSTTTAGDKTQWKPGAGFRIVPESPLSSRGPTPVPPDDSAPFGMTWATAHAPDRYNTPDKYTPAPARHDTSRNRSRSRSASPVKSRTGPSTPARPHAAVLPHSPPQVTSPFLEDNLCFASRREPPRTPLSPTSSAGRPRHMSTPQKLRSPTAQPFFMVPAAGVGDIDSPNRSDVLGGRLSKSPAKAQRAQRPPMTSKNSSLSTTSYTRDTNGRAIVAAMKKVEEIVDKSWGARDLDERGVRALSPTGFGRTTGL